jgi:chaperonin cofactor prefoldin
MPDAPVSWGELIDKITILEIKAERLTAPAALANVQRELDALRAVEAQLAPDPELAGLKAQLVEVNGALWDIEDHIRDQEAAKDFGPRFVELARSVYVTNDRRAALKREINRVTDSELVEEKSYADYGAATTAEG